MSYIDGSTTPTRDVNSAVEFASTVDSTGAHIPIVSLSGGGGGGQTVVGPAADDAAASGNPILTAGKAINVASPPGGYAVNDVSTLRTDKDSSALVVTQAKLTRADDKVSADPNQYSTVSTATPVTTDSTVFTLAANEKGFIQNLDDAAVYVKYGASASSSSFNFVLKAGLAADDGNGGSLVIDDFIGAVSIAAATGSPRVAAFKLS